MDCSPKKWPLAEGLTLLQGPVTIDNFCCSLVSRNFAATQASGKLPIILTPLNRSLEQNRIKFYFTAIVAT